MSEIPHDQPDPLTLPPLTPPSPPETQVTDTLPQAGVTADIDAVPADSPERSDQPNAECREPSAGSTSAEGGSPSRAVPHADQEIKEGGIRRGKVLDVTPERVLLDLGGQVHGSVPFIEFAGHPMPRIGDEVSVIVEHFTPETGQVVLSKRHADEFVFWQLVQPGELLEGVVTGMNKGGLDIDIGGARAFLPASQVAIHRMKDISVLIGEHVRCMVTQVDRTTKDLIVSRRKVIEKERDDQRLAALRALVEGETRTGKISNLTEYGAFVNLDGVDGLIHITDLSWARIRHPSEVVQIGQEVQVQVLKVDHEKGKVSLGLKQLRPNPWDTVETRYPVGSRVRGRVARLADFGAFLELEQGVDALLPLSEMGWSRRINHPSEIVKVGDEHEVVVLKVEPGKQRISVGLKQTQEDPWTTVTTRFPVNGSAKGKVSRVMDFGAFVELVPGLEGLVHISELADRRVEAVGDVVQEGQEVEVRVLKVDTEAQRISLSMRKPPPARPARASPEPEDARAKAKKARKKPLRGGLASHFEW